VVATWSVRTLARDPHGLRIRLHFPQLAEAGGHDPSLEPGAVARLPSLAAVPDWMVPDTVFRTDPKVLVRDHPDFASVRFVQPAEPLPTYAGPLVIAGLGWQGGAGGVSDRSLGLGFGAVGESPLVLDRISLDLLFVTPAHGPNPRSTLLRVGGSLAPPRFGVWREWGLRWLDHLRLEIGHAWVRGGGEGAGGTHRAIALESPTIPLRVVYAGLTVRVGYRWTGVGEPGRGPAAELVLQ